jgi:SAM-dependent methyltransferase
MAVGSSTTERARSVLEHFDRYSASGRWSALYAGEDGKTYHFHTRRRRVLELLPDRLGDVLDVGCGPGVMVDSVLERGGTFLGVDVSSEMVKEGSEKYAGREGVRFKIDDIEKLDLPSSSFDQVICMGVIEYLATPDRAFAEMFRVLRPGGVACVTIPRRWHIDTFALAATAPGRALARAFGATASDRLPRLRMQADELDSAARGAGFEVDGGSHYHFTPLPYPFTRLAPRFSMRANLPFEALHASRRPLSTFLSHGYIGRYRRA